MGKIYDAIEKCCAKIYAVRSECDEGLISLEKSMTEQGRIIELTEKNLIEWINSKIDEVTKVVSQTWNKELKRNIKEIQHFIKKKS